MATEVNQNYFAWSQEEPVERDGSQGVSVSQMLGHGSISFGRFELESLAWEKWSVFTNDRRHEEFGKFNGLVAEKKAYFEEYYKKIRELKALQQQNLQTELTLEYSGDGTDSSQAGEDEPATEREAPAGSKAVVDHFTEQAAAETTSDNTLKCYDDHENLNLNTEFSSLNLSLSAGGLQSDQEMRENASGDNSADMVDVLQQNASSGHDLGMPHETIVAPKRIIGKSSHLRQASKIIPKSVKMPSINLLNHTVASKGSYSVKPGVSMNQKTKPENVHSLQRPKAASHNMAGTIDKSKLMAKEAPWITSVRRPSSSAGLQWPSTGVQRSVTRDGAQELAEVTTSCRPSTAERRPVTRDAAPKHDDIVTPRRPSTAERRPVTRQTAVKHAYVVTPCQPSTAARRALSRETALKSADVFTARRPSTAERCPVTRETAPKHADMVIPYRPSTAERHPVIRETTLKHANVLTPCQPSNAEGHLVTRATAVMHADVATPCWPSTSERHLLNRESAGKPAGIDIDTPHRPSTREKRRVTSESTLKMDPRTPSRTRATVAHPNGALTTVGTPKKAVPPNAVKSSKPETKSYVKERQKEPSILNSHSTGSRRVELKVAGKPKSCSASFPPRKMLSSKIRGGVLENFARPNKEGIQERVQSRVSVSVLKNITPLQPGRVKARAPDPLPPPPPLRRSSLIAIKPDVHNFSGSRRKPKSSTPQWH